jgi:hypothetical protein
MSTIVTRAGKGSPLTHNEVDANFNNLNSDKYESGSSPSFAGTTLSSGNLTFSGTAQRITGDMTNGALSSRLYFQTSTANSNTSVGAIPSGTAQVSSFNSFNSSDPNNAALLQAQALSTDVRLNSNAVGTGTYLPMTFYTGGSERVRIDTSGSVGIGTASPGYQLELSKANTSFRMTDAGANSTYVSAETTTTTAFIGVARQGGNPSSAFLTAVGNSSFLSLTGFSGTANLITTESNGALSIAVNGSERMRIDSSGNVGIGTASPVSGYRLNVVVDSGNAQQLIRAGTNFNSTISFGDQDSNTSGQLIYAHNGDFMRFDTNGSERMRIDSSGNVGIGGTAGASAKVNVLGTLPTNGAITNVFWAEGTIPSGTTSDANIFRSSTTTAAASFTLSNLTHFWANPQAFGAGSSVTNQYGFLVGSALTGATNNFGFYSNIASGSNRWNFFANGTAQNYFAGNVGIGTTSPSALLTVSKSASTSIDDYSGHFIVSGSTTNAGRFIWSQNSTYALAVALNSTASTSGNAVFQWITRSTGVLESSPLTLSVNGNIGISGTSFGSGVLVMFIANATTVPSTNPTGGGILYVEGGALKYRGSSGTVTTIANA